MSPGDQLIDRLAGCSGHLTVVAPFIKVGALARLLSVVDGCRLNVYTRWLPSEVALGVSDLEVFDLVRDVGGELRLLRELHAKAFAFDGTAFVGSTNVTSAALGWSSQPNLELLTEVDPDLPELVELLATLARFGIPATRRLQEAVYAAAQELLVDPSLLLQWASSPAGPLAESGHGLAPEGGPTRDDSTAEGTSELAIWVPETPDPARFIDYHQGHGQLSLSGEERADRDLQFLQVGPHTAAPTFVAGIRDALEQTLFVQLVRQAFDAGGGEELAFADFCAQARLDPNQPEAQEYWVVVVNWLTHFFRSEFTYGPTQEGLIRKGRDPLGYYG